MTSVSKCSQRIEEETLNVFYSCCPEILEGEQRLELEDIFRDREDQEIRTIENTRDVLGGQLMSRQDVVKCVRHGCVLIIARHVVRRPEKSNLTLT